MQRPTLFRHLLTFSLLCVMSLCLHTLTYAKTKPLKVVTSFSIIADMVEHVGGSDVEVSCIVQAGSDTHMFEPSAKDTRLIANADILFINGLGFEPWMDRLQNAAGFKGVQVIVSQGVQARTLNPEHAHEHHDHHQHDEHSHHAHNHHHAHTHGEYDPHAWQDVRNAIIYVRNIEQALSLADPAHATQYMQRAQAYIAKLEILDHDIRTAFAEIPENRRILVTTHDAFGYFAQAYGLKVLTPIGFSTDAQPSAASFATLIKQIKQLQVSALFLENVSNPKLMAQLQQETGITIGGELYSDALSTAGTQADTYIKMMRCNLAVLLEGLAQHQ